MNAAAHEQCIKFNSAVRAAKDAREKARGLVRLLSELSPGYPSHMLAAETYDAADRLVDELEEEAERANQEAG